MEPDIVPLGLCGFFPAKGHKLTPELLQRDRNDRVGHVSPCSCMRPMGSSRWHRYAMPVTSDVWTTSVRGVSLRSTPRYKLGWLRHHSLTEGSRRFYVARKKLHSCVASLRAFRLPQSSKEAKAAESNISTAINSSVSHSCLHIMHARHERCLVKTQFDVLRPCFRNHLKP